jgi:GMP synthase-like glutamine amidotransferase
MGLVGEWARERGASVEVVRAPELEEWPDTSDADAIVALGSDRSVHASHDAWIARQLRWLRSSHDAGVAVLGICFGAQALAAALGGSVARSPAKEIGWISIEGEERYAGEWFTWHEDAFTPPPGATELARNAAGVQAFAVGRSIGVQFHPEVDAAIVEDWLATGRDSVPYPEAIRRETARRMVATRERAFALFDAIAARWRR